MIYVTKKQTEQQVLDHFENLEIDGVGYETTTPKVVWNWYVPTKDWSVEPLTLVAHGNGYFAFKQYDNWNYNGTLYYSVNGGDWPVSEYNSIDTYTEIPVSSGDVVSFWNDSMHPEENSGSGMGFFISSCEFEAMGNVMSMALGDYFIGVTSFEDVYSSYRAHLFQDLFHGCGKLLGADNLILPVTDMSVEDDYYMPKFCYASMFAGCTAMTKAPVLPATVICSGCYASMFNECESLTTAPELPATTLANACYFHMFAYCNNLTTAPDLPATTLVDRCYQYMFQGCTSLNYVKCLAETGMTIYTTTDWLKSVSPTGTFVKSANMSSWPSGSSGIPNGWNVVDY